MTPLTVELAVPSGLVDASDPDARDSGFTVPVVRVEALRELREGLHTLAYSDWTPALNAEIQKARQNGEIGRHKTPEEWLAQRLLALLPKEERS